MLSKTDLALNTLVALSLCAILSPAFADERSDKTLKVLLNDNQRIQALEKQVKDHEWTITRGFEAADKQDKAATLDQARLATRIAELERKVAGMQKEITRLHAMKANK